MTDEERWIYNLQRWRERRRTRQFPAFELCILTGGNLDEWRKWWESIPLPLIEGRMIAMKHFGVWDMIPAGLQGICLSEVHWTEVKHLRLNQDSVGDVELTEHEKNQFRKLSSLKQSSEDVLKRWLERVHKSGEPWPKGHGQNSQ